MRHLFEYVKLYTKGLKAYIIIVLGIVAYLA